MPAPGMEHTDSTNSLASDEMNKADDLPGLEQNVEATARSDVAAIVDSEVGSLGGPGLVSEGTHLGEITPGSDSDEIGESPLVSEGDAPALMLGGNRVLIDGLSQADDENAMAAPPIFIPRGRIKFQAVTKKDDENKKDKDKKDKDKKDKDPNKPKDPKNDPKAPVKAGGK